MNDRLTPNDAGEVEQAIGWALAHDAALEIRGAGSKRSFGREVQAARLLDLSRLSGLIFYEPEELVFSARAATPIAQIEALLDERRQMLAFEPPDLGPLLGSGPGAGTLGGAIACNLSGPRRIKAGAARDQLLGCAGVSGRGESFKTGGRVMKNVTGYDLCKLMAGSFGTLAALTEITCKVSPKPEMSASLLLFDLDPARASEAMRVAAAMPSEVSGFAYLPLDVARHCQVPIIAEAAAPVTVLRIEGPAVSVERRIEALENRFRDFATQVQLGGTSSEALWRKIRDAEFFAADAANAIWRVSVAPMQGAALGEAIARETGGRYYLDWAGGLIWLSIPENQPGVTLDGLAGQGDAAAAMLRVAMAKIGGHASLVRGSSELRAIVPVFEPEPPALAALSQRIKNAFDPKRILNPGRMRRGG